MTQNTAIKIITVLSAILTGIIIAVISQKAPTLIHEIEDPTSKIVGNYIIAIIVTFIVVVNLLFVMLLIARNLEYLLACPSVEPAFKPFIILYRLFLAIVFPPLLSLQQMPSCIARQKLKTNLIGRPL